MTTRDKIIHLGDLLIKDKGYNAFSFTDISRELGIKNAAIHYYFPSKADLAIQVIRHHISALEAQQKATEGKTPLERLKEFMGIYVSLKDENRICLVGSLASDLHGIDESIGNELKYLSEKILAWVSAILQDGKALGQFHFMQSPRTKALMIITNMLASLQLTRLTCYEDFVTIRQTIIDDLMEITEKKN